MKKNYSICLEDVHLTKDSASIDIPQEFGKFLETTAIGEWDEGRYEIDLMMNGHYIDSLGKFHTIKEANCWVEEKLKEFYGKRI